MSILKNKLFLGVATGLILGCMPAFAYNEATLTGIEINPYNESTYQVLLKTDKKVPIHKIVTSDNKIILKLKNTKPAGFVNTVYNNTPSIDHVIIQPSSGDEVKVYVEGVNIAQSIISLDSANSALSLMAPVQNNIYKSQQPVQTKTEIPVVSEKSQNVNNLDKEQSVQKEAEKVVPDTFVKEIEPIAEEVIQISDKPEFKPVMNFSTEEEVDKKSNLNQLISSMGLGFVKKLMGDSLIDNIIRVLALLVIVIGAFKLLKPREKQVQISLNSSKNIKDKEIDLFKQLNNKRGLIGTGLKSMYDDPAVLKKNVSSVNYGLNEYKNSQVAPKTMGLKSPPRLSPEDIGFKPSLNSEMALGRVKTPKTSLNRQQSFNSTRITPKEINSAKVNIDNVKFLETMAQIYEKSGRSDLASGIQSSLKKSNMAM